MCTIYNSRNYIDLIGLNKCKDTHKLFIIKGILENLSKHLE